VTARWLALFARCAGCRRLRGGTIPAVTAVALYRGPAGTFNALAVDTLVSLPHLPDAPWLEEKLRRPYGETYVTAIGSSLLLHAVSDVVDWLDPKRPNLKSVGTAGHILGAYDRRQQLNEALLEHQPAPLDKGVVLFVCSRADAYFWVGSFDKTASRSRPPTQIREVEPGKCAVMCGSDGNFVNFEKQPGDPLDFLPRLIMGVEQEYLSQGKTGLPYKLNGRFSVVVLPHKPSVPIRRKQAFASLPERLAYLHGEPGEALFADADFMSLDPSMT
jgi:hypothetical protein